MCNQIRTYNRFAKTSADDKIYNILGINLEKKVYWNSATSGNTDLKFFALLWSDMKTCRVKYLERSNYVRKKHWKAPFPVYWQWVTVGRTKAKSARLILGENSLPFTQKSTRSYQVTRSFQQQQPHKGVNMSTKQNNGHGALTHFYTRQPTMAHMCFHLLLEIAQRTLAPFSDWELPDGCLATTNWFVCQLEVNLGFSSTVSHRMHYILMWDKAQSRRPILDAP